MPDSPVALNVNADETNGSKASFNWEFAAAGRKDGGSPLTNFKIYWTLADDNSY